MSAERNTEKLKFLNWVFRWAYNNDLTTENTEIDLIQIATMLQAFDYKLEKIETAPLTTNEKTENKIEIYCSKSGMKAILNKQDLICTCPPPKVANQGTFWEISGSGPSKNQENFNKINESSSNLLPIIPKENVQIIKDVLNKLFLLINMSENNNNNNKLFQDTPREITRVRSLENIKKKPELKRQSTWEVDPRTTPPIKTSSPLPDLNKSFGQLSIIADKSQMLPELLQTIKDSAEKALTLIPTKNSTFTKKVKRVSNIKVSPTVSTPTRSTTGKSTPNIPFRKTPIKTPQNEEKKTQKPTANNYLNVQSKLGSFRNKKPNALTPTGKNQEQQKVSTSPQVQAALNTVKKKSLLGLNKFSSLKGSATNLATMKNSVSTSNLTNLTPNVPKATNLLKNNRPGKSGIPSFGLKMSKNSGISSLNNKLNEK